MPKIPYWRSLDEDGDGIPRANFDARSPTWHEKYDRVSYQEFCISMQAQMLGVFNRENVVWVFELDELLQPQPYWLDEESGVIAPAKEIWGPPEGIKRQTAEEENNHE